MTWIRNPRVAGTALATSLLLNLFLGGFVIARLVGRPDFRARMGFDHPAAHRAAPLRAMLERQKEAFRATRARVQSARQEVQAALVTDPLDEQALRAALAELRAQTGAAQATLHDALVEAAKSLPLEQRKAMAESRRLWHGPGGHRPGRPSDGHGRKHHPGW